MKNYTIASVKKMLETARVRIHGNVIHGWRDKGIKTQGRIDFLVNYHGYARGVDTQ